MDFHTQLVALKNKSVTLYIIGSSEEYAGELLDIGEDFVTLDSGPDDAPHRTNSLIPIAAISCVAIRV
jgi:hypothetical protein